MLKRFKINEDRKAEEQEYYQDRRENSNLMSRKKIETRNRIMKEIAEDKTPKTSWKKVNSKRKRR